MVPAIPMRCAPRTMLSRWMIDIAKLPVLSKSGARGQHLLMPVEVSHRMKRKPIRNTYWYLMMMSRVRMLSLPTYALRFLFFFKSPYLPFFLVHSKISMVLQLASPFFGFLYLHHYFLYLRFFDTFIQKFPCCCNCFEQ